MKERNILQFNVEMAEKWSKNLCKHLPAKWFEYDLVVLPLLKRRFSTTPKRDLNKNVLQHVCVNVYTEMSYQTNLFEILPLLSDYFHEGIRMDIWERPCTWTYIKNDVETGQSPQHFVIEVQLFRFTYCYSKEPAK